MQYIEIKCYVHPPESGNEILIALLSEIGCESFMEVEEGVLAYISKQHFQKEKLDAIHIHDDAGFTFTYDISEIPEQNWNAVWESNYPPVMIEDICYIRAPFHEAKPDIPYEIVIEPKMSFGTAHHETTALMISYLLHEDCTDKIILDMGSGTGILAILAALRNAKKVTAIDNDEWAYANCRENCERNAISIVECILGDAENIKDEYFDIIFANINYNILVRDLPIYVKHMKKNSLIFLSGFYETKDLDAIKKQAMANGLSYHSHKQKNQWVAAKFYRQ